MDVRNGFPIVLTADHSLMAGFRLLFDGILPAAQTTTIPTPFVRALLLPRATSQGPQATVAPLGLRRIEAALVRGGFSRDDVVVAHPSRLRGTVGLDTRVVGISVGEPTGLGMNTTTMRAIAGGRPFPSVMFTVLLRRIRRELRRAGATARIVVGGPGAWQLAQQPEECRRLGVDHVVVGNAEGNATEIFRRLFDGEPLPEVIAGKNVPAAEIPPILGASTMGVVEISRGCGLGCPFCTVAKTPMRHLTEDTIVADAKTNLAHGMNNICLISEDIFRYGGEGLCSNSDALISLLTRLRELPGVRLIQTDHGNIASIVQYRDDELAAVRQLMVGSTGQEMPWVNVGVETASGRLLRAAGCSGKMGRISDGCWAEACEEQLRRLRRAGFFPIVSIILGLPDESEDDIRSTLAWVESLRGAPVAVFPLLLAPIDGSRPLGPLDITRLHWRLVRTCYALNFKWVPKMYRDSQRAGGTPLARRLVMDLLAVGQSTFWKVLLRWRSWRCPRAR